MKPLAWILLLGLGCFLCAGCSKSTDTGGGGNSAEKSAITQVLKQDFALRGGSAKTRPDSMRAIDIQNCPPSFRDAYQKHISAWEKNDLNLIEDTWAEVKRIAREHGVDVKPFE